MFIHYMNNNKMKIEIINKQKYKLQISFKIYIFNIYLQMINKNIASLL